MSKLGSKKNCAVTKTANPVRRKRPQSSPEYLLDKMRDSLALGLGLLAYKQIELQTVPEFLELGDFFDVIREKLTETSEWIRSKKEGRDKFFVESGIRLGHNCDSSDEQFSSAVKQSNVRLTEKKPIHRMKSSRSQKVTE